MKDSDGAAHRPEPRGAGPVPHRRPGRAASRPSARPGRTSHPVVRMGRRVDLAALDHLSQRFTDLQQDPRIAIVIDDGHGYEELRGVEIAGRARVVGEVPRTGELAVPELEPVERAFAVKYQGRETLTYDGRHAWLTVDVTRSSAGTSGRARRCGMPSGLTAAGTSPS